MKHVHGRRRLWPALGFLLVAHLFMTTTPALGGTRDAQWKKVDEAVSKGLPRSAITNLEPIIAAALKEKAYAEAVKAIGRKIALEGTIEGNKPEEKIVRLEAEIARAPREMVPMLDTLLAHWYWHYFQQNRWRFLQRTATAQAPGKDFTTWDLPRLFVEIDKQFQKALAAERFLKATPVTAWDDLLQKGTMPDSLRPTLYDFVAYEALQFYTSGEQAAAKPQDAFEIPADTPVFDSVEKFLAWKPPQPETAKDQFTPSLRALRLYQDLLRFHLNDAPPAPALAHADLERLAWAWNTAYGEDKNARYKQALESFARAQADFEISAIAMERHARVLQQEGDLVGAHKLASRGAQLFPNSPGGKLCRNLVTQIESRNVAVTTERVWNSPWPKLSVRYKNVEAIHFRAIPWEWRSFLEKRHNRPENLNNNERKEVLAKSPALEWSEKLAPTKDFKETTAVLPAPQKLPPGYYFIAASPSPAFDDRDNIVFLTDVWVSDLALITRQRAGLVEGFVLEANSGEPLPGAEILNWHLDLNGTRVAGGGITTDADGFFSFAPEAGRNYVFLARHNGRELGSPGDLWGNPRFEPNPLPAAQTIFFTDRAIYRPGQTVQYKGLCLWVDQAKDNYELLKGEELTVVFKDPNGKEISRQKQRTGDFGTFSGSFTAPRDRLAGAMMLEADGRARGAASIRVEEYKRPKFQVTLERPTLAPKLNDKVTLKGLATAYTGAAIDDAPVKYRVVREVRMPWWWGWWRGRHRQSQSQEIAHGTRRTGTDGAFTIEFVAKPDSAVPEKDDPSFVYSVYADVTDSAGETRSAETSVRVGYTALEVSMAANQWQTTGKPVQVTLSARSLDGQPQVAEGNVKVYSLVAPQEVQRPVLAGNDVDLDGTPDPDQSSPNNWPLGKVAAEKGFTTDTNGNSALAFDLPPGAYRAVLETQDRFGKPVRGELQILVLDPDAETLALKVPNLLEAPKWDAQPGEEFMALWGTGYKTGRAFVEIEHRHRLVKRYWTTPGRTQQQIKLAVTEAMRGGFTVHLTQVRENRAYLLSRRVGVAWKNKELDVSWERLVSKLLPGQKETWTAVIKPGPGAKHEGEKLAAEFVATLYDESLDAFAPLSWQQRLHIFRQDHSTLSPQFANSARQFYHVLGRWDSAYAGVNITYRSWPADLSARVWGYGFAYARRARAGVLSDGAMPDTSLALGVPAAPAVAQSLADFSVAAEGVAEQKATAGRGAARAEAPAAGPKPDLGQVAARKNLNETAFFFPHLSTDSNGVVRMTFTMPEALTRWHFYGFAHDAALRSGFLENHAVTAKDLMVQPNPPRFLREGDTVEFTVKISNQSDKPQAGTARLSFADASTGQSADKLLRLARSEQTFSVPARESRTLSWRISVPDGCGFLTYKAVAATTTLSDGEEGALPVLSRRILVTESLPLPIRGPGTKRFEFTKLLKSSGSRTLEHQSLTVQMVSQPAWYAVLALPYLMEYPHECSEQVFNRLYANSLARSIALSDPKIHRVFEQWRNTPALDSPLEKNEDLKSVALQETPWLRQAQAESQARRNVGILFDDNRLNSEIERAFEKLAQMQLQDGAFPWFPGGPPNDYITLYITTGFGRLRHLGVDVRIDPALRSLERLDAWMTEHYNRILEHGKPDEYVPSHTDALYLYGRSFFLKDRPVAEPHRKAVEFFQAQARRLWLQVNSRQSQGHLAIALHRWTGDNNAAAARDIINSLRERSVANEEMGMFWRETELSWWWYRAPIETQALMIEAFDEVARDARAVEDCKVWLLKQKQTQDWKTTKATADAVYALLLRGRNLLSSDALVQVKLDGIDVTPAPGQPGPRPEPGTGFYERRFKPSEIKPKMGEITVKKTDQGVSWGSVHWQYLEDMTKVTPYEGTPLKLKKTLFTKKATNRGPVLEPVKAGVAVGDELVVRIELRTDRDMEYVHLKDQRGSGTEPVNVLSQYKFQDGLAYYESTRDTASHFFIDYLPKGTYVFEYSSRVQLRGDYQTGVAEIQCMYAPEFNSHSESFRVKAE